MEGGREGDDGTGNKGTTRLGQAGGRPKSKDCLTRLRLSHLVRSLGVEKSYNSETVLDSDQESGTGTRSNGYEKGRARPRSETELNISSQRGPFMSAVGPLLSCAVVCFAS